LLRGDSDVFSVYNSYRFHVGGILCRDIVTSLTGVCLQVVSYTSIEIRGLLLISAYKFSDFPHMLFTHFFGQCGVFFVQLVDAIAP